MHEKATPARKNGYDLAANYNMGPLALGAGYSQVDEDKQAAFRATYTFGQFVVGGYYQRNDEEIRGTRNNFRLSGMYTLGASEFHVNVGHANQWTLGYNYNLSKRTKVYGYYTKVDNKAGANYMTGVKGADFSSFALGVRHAF
jgi:predicted porin